MDSLVFAAVLFAAACHAGWNAAIKIGSDTVSVTALIAVGAGIVGVALLPFAGLPLAAAWPWVAASVVIHLFYFIGLSEGYRVGDLGQVYPLARGTAPLMTATLSVPLVGEALGPLGWGGIIALAGGVLLLSARGGRALARFDAHATGLALFTAITICAYSLVDGIGARLAGSANAYTACLFIGNGVVLAAYAMVRLRGKVFAAMAPYWATGLAGGGLQFVSYGIAIWAMTVAPIAIVAALRETSVLFGTALAVVFLKEPLRPVRIAAAVMMVSGLLMIRLRDEITREVLTALRRSFITPLDRGDIKDLITSMDDAIDQMNQTAKLIALFELRSFEPPMQEMGEIIVRAATLIVAAVPLLGSLAKESGQLDGMTEEIIRLEEHADQLHDQGRKHLFQTQKDAIAFVIGTEVYDHLESVMDRFEDVANEISAIVIENV